MSFLKSVGILVIVGVCFVAIAFYCFYRHKTRGNQSGILERILGALKGTPHQAAEYPPHPAKSTHPGVPTAVPYPTPSAVPYLPPQPRDIPAPSGIYYAENSYIPTQTSPPTKPMYPYTNPNSYNNQPPTAPPPYHSTQPQHLNQPHHLNQPNHLNQPYQQPDQPTYPFASDKNQNQHSGNQSLNLSGGLNRIASHIPAAIMNNPKTAVKMAKLGKHIKF